MSSPVLGPLEELELVRAGAPVLEVPRLPDLKDIIKPVEIVRGAVAAELRGELERRRDQLTEVIAKRRVVVGQRR